MNEARRRGRHAKYQGGYGPHGELSVDVTVDREQRCAKCGESLGYTDDGWNWFRQPGFARAANGRWYLTARARRRAPRDGGGQRIPVPVILLCPRCGEEQTITG